MGESPNKRFWEQTKQIKQSIEVVAFRCPVCGTLLFNVPIGVPMPSEKTEIVCKNGHKVRVPKFDDCQKIGS